MQKPIELSIITVNYNGFSDTCELIESVRNHLSISYELIVIDNASGSNEAERLKERYPWVITIRSETNLGFAGGNNIGIRASRGRFILLLNNDTIIKDDTLRFVTERLDSDAHIGAVSPKIKYAFPPEDIQYAGYTRFTPITLRNQTIGHGEQDRGQYDLPVSMPYLHGAAMMLKREVIEKVGMMPEIYFLYYEEMDWCSKIRRGGFSLYYEPKCTIYHKESQSTGQASPLRTFFITRNRLLYAYRNLEGRSKYLSLVYQLSLVLPKNSITFLFNGRTDLIKAAFSGALSFIFLKNKNN
ncbi:MAG: glycosyltransferase family 2 protein [Prolixibacteraceae bacterium]